MNSCFRFLLIVFLSVAAVSAQDMRTMTLPDIMKFRQISGEVISADGSWIAYISKPDRGDTQAVFRATANGASYKIPNGQEVQVADGGAWGVVLQGPDAVFQETADKKEKKDFKPNAILVNLANGEQMVWENVKSYGFSDDGQWLAILQHPARKEKAEDDGNGDETPEGEPAPEGESPNVGETPKEAEAATSTQPPQEAEKKKKKKKKNKEEVRGGRLVLRKLISGHEIEVADVIQYAFSGKGTMVAYAVSTEEGLDNGLYCRNLAGDHSAQLHMDAAPKASFPQFSFSESGSHLAWLKGVRRDEDASLRLRSHELKVWDAQSGKVFPVGPLQDGWHIPSTQELTWSKDGQRLFFGTRPIPAAPKPEIEDEGDVDLFDMERLLAKKGLDVWHGNDPLIKTHARKEWKKESKRTYAAVWHLDSRKMVPLADETAAELRAGEQENHLLLTDDRAYQRGQTWGRFFQDLYAVNLKTGKRTKIVDEVKPGSNSSSISLSPESEYVAYYKNEHYYLHQIRTGKVLCLTQNLGVPFADEDNDFPGPVSGYGIAGWLAEDAGVMIYDKYDIWVFPTQKGEPYRLTGGDGRQREVAYRIVPLDKEKRFYAKGEKILLHAKYTMAKNHGFYHVEVGKPFVEKRMEDLKQYHFVAKAKRADILIYTREEFSEFPDIWASDSGLNRPKRLTNENPQLSEFIIGTPQLISWKSVDGVDHQGILYLPGNYEEGKRYPVLVYYYRIFSDRMYSFNKMEINHRPNFPYYTSNGYAVFLPDVHFKVGTPGASATKSLVPGVQKLVDMGIADPDAIGLHGHSWSGYQTAFVITQTDIFKAAVAGAPVSNMTSAYSGIRLGTGMARQFQYETGQSRIGANMWERRDLYIENSPVFFADRINTPLLIQFGDIDEAVPWQQGIELYLAMRRLDKEVIFLQYHDEPHHLKKYPNKLDYTIKMKEFFDHHLLGKPAPAWMTEGVPYQGE